MKTSGISILSLLSLIVTLGIVLCGVSGCGNNRSSNTAAVAAITASCGAGYTYSSTYGCIAQSSCQSGYGLYNGACVYTGTTATTLSSGCISIAQAIPFTGSAVQIDSTYRLYAGTIPSYSTYGSTTIGTTSTISGTSFSNASATSAYSRGVLQFNVQSSGSSAITAGTTADISGSITIGSTAQQLIVSSATAATYGTSNTPCVSGIAIMGQLSTNGAYGFTGYVYLYLNGTQHGYQLLL